MADNDDIDAKDLIRLLLHSADFLNKCSLFGSSTFDETLQQLSRAQQLVKTADDQDLLGTVLLHLGQAHDYHTMNTGEGDYQVALDYLEQALTLYRATANQPGIGNAIFHIGLIHQRKQEWQEAKTAFANAYDIAVDGHYLFAQSLAIRHLGFIHFVAKEYERAEACARESLKLRQDLGYRLYLPPAHHVLGNLFIVLERWEEALDHLEQANTLAEEMKLDAYLVHIQLTLGEWHKRQGDKELARNCFQKAYDTAVKLNHLRWRQLAEADLKSLEQDQEKRDLFSVTALPNTTFT
jgi:tetratricopeptide (TPR) repeat protein